MSNDYTENIARPAVRRIKRVLNVIDSELVNNADTFNNLESSNNFDNSFRDESNTIRNVRLENRRESRPVESRQTEPENLTLPTQRIEATGENAAQIVSLVSNIERKLTETFQTGMIGVFGVNSDTVVRDAINRVRVDYVEFLRITYDMDYNDIYLVIAATVYNFLEDLNRRHRMDSYNLHTIRRNLSDILVNPSHYATGDFDYLYALAGSQEKASRMREIFSEIKRVFFGNTRQKFIISIEIGPGYFRNDILHKLNNICSSDVVIIVNTLRPLEMESDYLSGSFGRDSPLYMQKYFNTIDTLDCN